MSAPTIPQAGESPDTPDDTTELSARINEAFTVHTPGSGSTPAATANFAHRETVQVMGSDTDALVHVT